MKRIQSSLWGKLLASLLLLAGVCAGTAFGLRLIQALPFVTVDSFRETQIYWQLEENYQNKIADAFAFRVELEEPGLSYVERESLQGELDRVTQELVHGKSNFYYRVRTPDGARVLDDNLSGLELVEIVDRVGYGSFIPGQHYVYAQDIAGESHLEHTAEPYTEQAPSAHVEQEEYYILEYGVDKYIGLDSEKVVRDDFFRLERLYATEKQSFSTWVFLTVGCFVAAAAAFLYLMWTAGHKAGQDGIVLTWQEKIWFDLYVLVMFTAAVLIGAIFFEVGHRASWYLWEYGLFDLAMAEEFMLMRVGACVTATLLAAIVTLTARTFLVRLKARALARSTLLCRVLMWCWRWLVWLWQAGKTFLRSLPFLWRTVLVLICYLLLNCLLLQSARYNAFAGVLWVAMSVGVFLMVCWWSMGFHRLRKGSAAISGGNLSHQIDERRLPHDLKQHARELNNISGGLQTAVNEQMKSERFKAELITNVSHDLKTPLTSIINYVDLLKTTQQTDPKAEEYIQVLDRKAQRLKKLTEDLVEASKASTGTLTVNREKLGMGQLIDQALGEYAEKLESRRLSVITMLPEEETFVYADGRHLWRVLDNLLSNCCKYAMEGTRIYLELKRSKGQVVLSVKNISREPLNIPAQRLMERFVRGEESRSTEGSGLGLSIARSLTELQGGTFDLAVDGDLFKAIVTMPQAG